jgi:hypothetical protein
MMARTEVRSKQIKDGGVKREDLNTDISGRAVITKIIAGDNITISSTGVDEGTGDVTINAGSQSQNTSHTFSTITNNDTETTLGEIELEDDVCEVFQIFVSAQFDDNSEDKNYWAIISGAVRRRNSSNATLVGTVSVLEDDEGDPEYGATVDVEDEKLRIRVTGASSETVNWKCRTFFQDVDNITPIAGGGGGGEALLEFPEWDSPDAFDFDKVSAALRQRISRDGLKSFLTFTQLGSVAGTLKWYGGVLAPNGCIYGVPRDSTTILKIDTSDDSVSTFGSLSGTAKWFGGVLAHNGIIYCIPHTSTEILKIDPSTDTTSTIGSLSGATKWVGGVLAPNGCIYGVPYSSTSVLKIDPSTDTITTFGSLAGSNKWCGGVLAPDGKIYCCPFDSNQILVIDPDTDTTSTFSSPQSGSLKWNGLAIAPSGKIVGVPISNRPFLIINYKNESAYISTPGVGADNLMESAVMSFDGNIIGIPRSTGFVRIFDPIIDAFRLVNIDFGAATSKFVGGIAAPNGAIYFIPSSFSTVLKVDVGMGEFSGDFCLNPFFNKF